MSKLAILGKVSLNLAELASNLETQMERKLPITLRDGGLTREATLLVCPVHFHPFKVGSLYLSYSPSIFVNQIFDKIAIFSDLTNKKDKSAIFSCFGSKLKKGSRFLFRSYVICVLCKALFILFWLKL